MMKTEKYNFVGIDVDINTYEKMISLFDKWIKNKNDRSHHVACVNVNCCAEGLIDRSVQNLFNSADIVGPDSMPFVYWIRWVLRKKCDRLYAPDIITELCKISVRKGYSYYLYGGNEGVAKKMKDNLEHRFPGIKILGYYSPPFRPLTHEEDAAVCAEINRLSPDFVIVGLGSPKQDVWIQDHLHKIKGSVMIAAGATFDFFSGHISQAPFWIQKSGFEWLFRLLHDPKRLLKRYSYYNALFLWNFALQISGIKRFTKN